MPGASRSKTKRVMMRPAARLRASGMQTVTAKESAVNAAALQQHITRSLGFSLSGRRGSGNKAVRKRRVRVAEENVVVESTRLEPSLAQRRGLVKPPPRLLDSEEWKERERRSVERGDHKVPCAICRQRFGVRDQVILSCSHVFHAACIKSFENIVGVQFQCCPICRHAEYEKKTCYLGRDAHKEACAIALQSLFRGFAARALRKRLRTALYKTGGGSKDLRHTFYAQRIETAANRFVQQVQSKDDTIDRLFEELDNSLAISRSVFNTEMQNTSMLLLQNVATDANPMHQDSSTQIETIDWAAVRTRAFTRGIHDCAICMTRMLIGVRRGRFSRIVTVLDCSHCFHERCIQALEDFRNNNTSDVHHQCPMCRSEYKRRPLYVEDEA